MNDKEREERGVETQPVAPGDLPADDPIEPVPASDPLDPVKRDDDLPGVDPVTPPVPTD